MNMTKNVIGGWQQIANLPKNWAEAQSVSHEGKIYVIGGYVGSNVSGTSEFYVYDTETNKWSQLANIPAARTLQGMAQLDGKIYVFGGLSSGSSYHNNTYCYDIATNKWSEKAKLPCNLNRGQAFTREGKIYVLCQHNGSSFVGNFYTYDPISDEFNALADNPSSRYVSPVAYVGDKLYVMGGYNSKQLSTVYEYTFSTNTWKQLKDMTYHIRDTRALGWLDKIYIPGGADATELTNTMLVYDITNDSWNKGEPRLPKGRIHPSVCKCGNFLYVIGGMESSGCINTCYKIELPPDPEDSKYPTKYLYEIDSILYNEVDGELAEIGVNEVNEETLIEYGNDTLNKLLLASNDRIKLYIYNQNPSITGYRFNYTALWKGQTIIQDYDFNAEYSKALKFTATINENDIFRILLSNDSGTTWYGLDEEDNVVEVSIDDIELLGLTINQVNTMSAEKLGELIGESTTLRVAFYMKQAKSNVNMKLDHIRFEYK